MAGPWEKYRGGSAGSTAPVIAGTAKPDKPEGPPSGYRWGPGGSLVPIPGGPADKPAKPTADAKLVEAERTAAFLATRIKGGLADINAALRDSPSAAKPEIDAAIAGIFGETARNWANSPARQRIESAQLDVLDAALTLGTGAAYTREQLEGYRQSYFPQIGDDETTIRDKRNRVIRMLEAAKVKAGNAAPQIDEALSAVRTADPASRNERRDAAPQQGDYRQDVGVFGGGSDDPDPVKMSPEREAAWNHQLSELQSLTDSGASREEIIRRGKELGANADDPSWLTNLDTALAARAKGGRVKWVRDTASYAPRPPDISDVRGEGATDRSTIPVGAASLLLEGVAGRETADVFNRGALDVASFGTADEIGAAGQTIFGGGTMDENLARQRAIDDYDTKNNFGTRLAGQFVGGASLPMGTVRSVGNLALKGGAYGFGYGVGTGRGGIGDRAQSAMMGGAAGATGSTALGYAGKGINALLPRVIGNAPPEAANVLAAAERQGVPLNIADVRPGARNALATLEAMPGSSGPINRNITAGRDAMAERVTGLAGSGSALDEQAAGRTIREAGERTIQQTRGKKDRLYARAENLAGDTAIEARTALATLDGHIAQLSETPDSNAGLLSLLSGLKRDLSKPLSIGAIRNLRSSIRGEIGTNNLTASNADRIVGDVLNAASQDIAAGLANKPGALQAFQRADRFYRERQTYIDDVLKRFLGPKDKPMSSEQTLRTLRSMANPKGGDSRRFSEVMRALDKDERADIAATFAAQLGRKSEDEPFSPALFLSGVRQISGPVRRELFGADGAKALDDLATLANAKKGTVERLNNSGSGRVMNYRAMVAGLFSPTGGAGLFWVGGGNPLVGAAVGTVATGVGMGASRWLAYAFTKPSFVKALAEAPATTNPKAIDAHIGKLRQLAARDPNLRSAVEAIERSLLNSVNDNLPRAGTLAASPDGGPNEEQRR